jgi:hypothetical protein
VCWLLLNPRTLLRTLDPSIGPLKVVVDPVECLSGLTLVQQSSSRVLSLLLCGVACCPTMR